jgi:predicted SnoaL-like aldol condensation-catalyzing enzyme
VSLEENKALVRSAFERVINLREWELSDEIIAPDYIDHLAPPERQRGPEGLKEFARLQRLRYPDTHISVEDILAEGDRVVVRIMMRGTRADGKGIDTFRGSVWWRIAGGKIVERWGAAFAREKLV